MSDTETETTEYQLTDDVDRVVRAGLVLEADDTVKADPSILEEHGDVLEPVDQTAETDAGDDQEGE